MDPNWKTKKSEWLIYYQCLVRRRGLKSVNPKLHPHCWCRGDFIAEQKLASFAPTVRPNPLPLHDFFYALVSATDRLSKELNKIGHISQNYDMGCVCAPAIYQAFIFGLLSLILPTVIQFFTKKFHC